MDPQFQALLGRIHADWQASCHHLRLHRAELFDSLGRLDQSIAGPALRDGCRQWLSHRFKDTTEAEKLRDAVISEMGENKAAFVKLASATAQSIAAAYVMDKPELGNRYLDLEQKAKNDPGEQPRFNDLIKDMLEKAYAETGDPCILRISEHTPLSITEGRIIPPEGVIIIPGGNRRCPSPR